MFSDIPTLNTRAGVLGIWSSTKSCGSCWSWSSLALWSLASLYYSVPLMSWWPGWSWHTKEYKHHNVPEGLVVLKVLNLWCPDGPGDLWNWNSPGSHWSPVGPCVLILLESRASWWSWKSLTSRQSWGSWSPDSYVCFCHPGGAECSDSSGVLMVLRQSLGT